mmetsp:Transcript_9669/g.23876  ORF Transcript_9669/g.23876 Transcript_9669/m.23876 type:complete len:96 (+) Transcript_9669:469-756(+)
MLKLLASPPAEMAGAPPVPAPVWQPMCSLSRLANWKTGDATATAERQASFPVHAAHFVSTLARLELVQEPLAMLRQSGAWRQTCLSAEQPTGAKL